MIEIIIGRTNPTQEVISDLNRTKERIRSNPGIPIRTEVITETEIKTKTGILTKTDKIQSEEAQFKIETITDKKAHHKANNKRISDLTQITNVNSKSKTTLFKRIFPNKKRPKITCTSMLKYK